MEKLIIKFYSAFEKGDWQSMQSCYHEDAIFSDPVFQNLTAKETKAMWHMLTVSAKELILSFDQVKVQGQSGSCHWEAIYTFSKTGRKVYNKINAGFRFKDGKIIAHHDEFNLWHWSAMAFGLSGWALGWSPYFKGKIRSTARKRLENFIKSNPNYQ